MDERTSRRREDQVISAVMPPVLYPVHTPPLYWAFVGALGMIGVAGAGFIVYTLLGGMGPLAYMTATRWLILGVCGLLAVLPIVYVRSTREYRVQGAIRISRALVEVPDFRGDPLRFPVDRLVLHLIRVQVRVSMLAIPVARVSRGVILDLRADGVHRKISTLTLVDTDQAQCLLADLERVGRGEDPRGPSAFMSPPSPPRPHDALEAQLDRELAALD
jgi:hypothetical protein